MNGKRVPYVDRRFDVTNRALRDTDIIPGDYAFPIHPDFLDVDVQVDRFLHTGPTDFDGRIIAIDCELYGPNPDATISPGALKEYLRELRKHIGPRLSVASGPIRAGLCRILVVDFREFLFHALWCIGS